MPTLIKNYFFIQGGHMNTPFFIIVFLIFPPT